MGIQLNSIAETSPIKGHLNPHDIHFLLVNAKQKQSYSPPPSETPPQQSHRYGVARFTTKRTTAARVLSH